MNERFQSVPPPSRVLIFHVELEMANVWLGQKDRNWADMGHGLEWAGWIWAKGIWWVRCILIITQEPAFDPNFLP